MTVYQFLYGLGVVSMCSLVVLRVDDCDKIVKNVLEMTALRNETSHSFLAQVKGPFVELDSLHIRSLFNPGCKLEVFGWPEGFGNC
jgi:hypothetical protein